MMTITDKARTTTYVRQIKVNVSNNMKTVTGHVILTEGYWHGVSDAYGNKLGDNWFCMESRKAPEGLPLVDESSPIGSEFVLK